LLDELPTGFARGFGYRSAACFRRLLSATAEVVAPGTAVAVAAFAAAAPVRLMKAPVVVAVGVVVPALRMNLRLLTSVVRAAAAVVALVRGS
jgi:hypothetical protein